MDKRDKGQVSRSLKKGVEKIRQIEDELRLKKIEKIDEFLSILDDHISNKISDATADCDDSCAGYSHYDSSSKLEEALYKLFDIEVEDDRH